MTENAGQEQTGLSIVRAITGGQLDRKGLPEMARLQVVEFLYWGAGKSQFEVAEFLDVSRSTVQRLLKKIQAEMAAQLGTFETEEFARDFIVTARQMQGLARKAGNHDLLWKIETDLFDRLARMGVIRTDDPSFKLHIGDNVVNLADPGISALDAVMSQPIEDLAQLTAHREAFASLKARILASLDEVEHHLQAEEARLRGETVQSG